MDLLLENHLTSNSADYYLYEHRVKTNIIYKVMIVVLLFAIASLPFIYVDITVSASSMVRPVCEKAFITAAVSEYVDSVYVTEGARLYKGDIILTQRTQKDDNKHRYHSDKVRELSDKIHDLKALSKGRVPSCFHSADIRETYTHFQSQVRQIDTEREQYEIEWRKYKVLFDKGLISESEYNDVYYRYQGKLNELDVIKKNQKSSWEGYLYDYHMQMKETIAADNNLLADKQLYIVKSPIDGALEQFSGIYKGGFLYAGQQIALVSPNGKLCIECYVRPRDIAFIKEGMDVRIQIDALNYNEWGIMKGHVTDIASDLVSMNDLYFYKVKCALDKEYLILKHSDKQANIKKGMSATTHFMVTRQSLFTLIYRNIDEWVSPTQYKKR